MEKTESFFPNMTKYEVLKTNGDKRMVKRSYSLTRWNRKNNKKTIIDYCLQEKIQGFEDERWRDQRLSCENQIPSAIAESKTYLQRGRPVYIV